jgi:tRNA (guanine37-N1)-methyltransferase
VYANDKNPKSYDAMVKNAQLNKIRVNDVGAIGDSVDFDTSSNKSSLSHPNTTLHLYNACGREFLRHLVGREGIMPTDILMNLPASATDFLDAMQDIGTMYQQHHSHADMSKGQIEAILPRVHVYGFTTADDHILDMAERACAAMGCTVSDLGTRAVEGVNLASRQLTNDNDEAMCTWAGHNVRDVAPKKLMICLSFYVPSVVAFRGKEGGGEEPEAKRRKV